MRRVSLAHLTVLSLAPPAMVRVAARTGYDAVGLRLIPVAPDGLGYPLMDDAPMLAESRAALADTGLAVNDIEFVKLEPDTDVAALEPFFAAGAALGARHAIAAPYDPDLGRLADRFAAFCALGARYGIGGVLEFFPWTVVPDLGAALAVAEATGRPDAGVLVDALHFTRSGSRLAMLAAAPRARLPFLHLCDALAEAPATEAARLAEARAERLPPGEGALDLRAILAAMPPTIPVGLEVPMATSTSLEGAEAVARRVRAAAARLLGG